MNIASRPYTYVFISLWVCALVWKYWRGAQYEPENNNHFITIPRHVLIYLYLFALSVRCIRALHIWLVHAFMLNFKTRCLRVPDMCKKRKIKDLFNMVINELSLKINKKNTYKLNPRKKYDYNNWVPKHKQINTKAKNDRIKFPIKITYFFTFIFQLKFSKEYRLRTIQTFVVNVGMIKNIILIELLIWLLVV